MEQIVEVASITDGDAICVSKYSHFFFSMNFNVGFFPSTRLFIPTRLFGTKDYGISKPRMHQYKWIRLIVSPQILIIKYTTVFLIINTTIVPYS